jgi:hypothetical protein
MEKPSLWLLLSELRNPEIGYVIPSVAWMAGDADARFESYLESEREGRLFAETGSTVIGGHHHQQFNYLCAAFDVSILRLGRSAVFDSSVRVFGLPVIAEGDTPAQLYAALLKRTDVRRPGACFVGPGEPVSVGHSRLILTPYLFPEILHRRALGATASHSLSLKRLCATIPRIRCSAAFLSPRDLAQTRKAWPKLDTIDRVRAGDTWGRITLRIARRWKQRSRGVVFGDPPAVLSQLATHCRHARVAVYQPAQPLPPAAVQVSHYIETTSPIAAATAQLAVEIGNRVITGRQTGDGDIFEWSRHGVSIQIIDPNRPAFPAVECITHPWAKRDALETMEPNDAQLRRWARENKVLTTLVFHSGEVAHNEAMLALIEMAGWTGLKLGLGVHAARYETCPQLWELIGIPPSRGGALGLVEPLLHSGGLGVMAECHCPPALLRENCEAALARIREIAGPANVPRGYYAFMDSNLDRLDRVRGDLFSAISAAGLDYIVSSSLPGRNRILWRGRKSGCLALNQSPRVVHGASPFVRATTPEDLHTTMGSTGPGWMIATLDAPVISFAPYIWRHGGRFLRLVEEELRGEGRINVTPHVVARYARIIDSLGILPAVPTH